MTRWLLALAVALAIWLIAWPGMGCHLRGGHMEATPGPGKQAICVWP